MIYLRFILPTQLLVLETRVLAICISFSVNPISYVLNNRDGKEIDKQVTATCLRKFSQPTILHIFFCKIMFVMRTLENKPVLNFNRKQKSRKTNFVISCISINLKFLHFHETCAFLFWTGKHFFVRIGLKC